jgi:KDO2-lipid IV(A) lauroyltransferase
VPCPPAPIGPRAAERSVGWVAAALLRMPAWLAYAFADLLLPPLATLAWVHELRAGRSGRGARRNLRIVYRDSLGALGAWRLLARHGRHLAHLVVDVCRMPRLDAARISRHFDLDSLEPLRALLAEGRGLLCVSGHVGPWEILGHAASVSGLPVTVVTRGLGSGPVDVALARLRTSGGQRCLPQRGALRRLREVLARGEIAGLLLDEDERQHPLFTPFLGTLAATSPVAALLQRRSGAPIAVVSCERSARGRFRLRLWRIVRPPQGADRETELRAVTAEINQALGAAILDRPEQWLWGARRFATRPPGERIGADGLPPPAA